MTDVPKPPYNRHPGENNRKPGDPPGLLRCLNCDEPFLASTAYVSGHQFRSVAHGEVILQRGYFCKACFKLPLPPPLFAHTQDPPSP